jgi:hypothetical protein
MREGRAAKSTVPNESGQARSDEIMFIHGGGGSLIDHPWMHPQFATGTASSHPCPMHPHIRSIEKREEVEEKAGAQYICKQVLE